MEASTTMPMARMMPVRETMLKLMSRKYMPITVARMETGMEITTIKVVRTRRRKGSRTSTVRAMPCQAEEVTWDMEARTMVVVSITTRSSTPAGSSLLIFFNWPCTLSATSMELLPLCFMTEM